MAFTKGDREQRRTKSSSSSSFITPISTDNKGEPGEKISRGQNHQTWKFGSSWSHHWYESHGTGRLHWCNFTVNGQAITHATGSVTPASIHRPDWRPDLFTASNVRVARAQCWPSSLLATVASNFRRAIFRLAASALDTSLFVHPVIILERCFKQTNTNK